MKRPFVRIEPQSLSDSMTVVLTSSGDDANVLMCIVDSEASNEVRLWREEAERLFDVLGSALGKQP